jgi:monoterpene epsilon-lactone hydrolase
MMRANLFVPALRFVAVPALIGLMMFPIKMESQATTAGPQTNSSVVDADGTAHVTRVVPVPSALSPQAKAFLRNNYPDRDLTLAEQRAGTDKWQTGAGEASRKMYPVNIKDATVAGVPVRDVTPLTMEHADWVLMCVHGGGFKVDSGSFTESIPMANLVKTRVVSVLYRMAPEHPYPAAVDDAVAVYRELLKTYKPRHIAIYGTSAGAILTGEVAVRLKQLGLPEPAALGVFSGMGDFSQNGDSQAMYALRGLTGELPLPRNAGQNTDYIGTHDAKDPVISPIYADLHGMPPTLFITSGRDLLLSGTTSLHRAFLRAGVDARLIVFDGLPHAFWNNIELPETTETYGYMADFFRQQLSK